MSTATGSTRWRLLSNEKPLAVAIAAGVLATHIATIFGYWFHGIGLVNLDFPRFNAYLLYRAELGAEPNAIFDAASSTSRLLTGWGVHLFTGVVWAILYVAVIHPLLGKMANVVKALIWGAILATISALWWVPVLFNEFDLGAFSWNLDAFWGVVAIYLWHGIYAVNLALIYNPLSEDELAELDLARA